MTEFVKLSTGRKVKLGRVFIIRTKEFGIFTIERRISPVTRKLDVEYIVRLTRNGKTEVVGIKMDKFDAIDLARNTKKRLQLAKKAREVAEKAGRLGLKAGRFGVRAGKRGLGIAVRLGRLIEKETRPKARRKQKVKRKKKKAKKRKKKKK